MTSKQLLCAALMLLSGLMSGQAQNLADILFGENPQSDYMGQYNYNGKRKNGFGIQRFGNGDVYIGDFSEGKISGRGMYIANEEGIEHVAQAKIYVGKWYNGKKEGYGVCYDAQGKVVFNGRFAKDKPTADQKVEDDRQFVTEEADSTVYVGETLNGQKHGLGLTLDETGRIIFGSMKTNVRQGIGIVFTNADSWEVGRWNNGTFTAFNNSQTANSQLATYLTERKEQRKETRKQLLEAFGCFAQAGLKFTSIAADVKANRAAASSSGDLAEGTDAEVKSGMSKEYYQSMYDRWKSKAKKTLGERVNHKVKGKRTGDDGYTRMSSADRKLLRTYQNAMRQTRMIAKQNGYIIQKSSYETASY